jgi:RNA polymerase sigma-70 factor (ECF subfamily)
MRLRRNKYRDTDDLNDELAPAREASIGLRMDLETALDRLSDTARAVVWLHDVEGFTHEEIGAQMGKTPSFSKSQLARAHQKLRVWLDEGVTQ